MLSIIQLGQQRASPCSTLKWFTPVVWDKKCQIAEFREKRNSKGIDGGQAGVALAWISQGWDGEVTSTKGDSFGEPSHVWGHSWDVM